MKTAALAAAFAMLPAITLGDTPEIISVNATRGGFEPAHGGL